LGSYLKAIFRKHDDYDFELNKTVRNEGFFFLDYLSAENYKVV